MAISAKKWEKENQVFDIVVIEKMKTRLVLYLSLEKNLFHSAADAEPIGL